MQADPMLRQLLAGVAGYQIVSTETSSEAAPRVAK